jgi:ribosome-binding protein aMBF1 (putative translation factor)
MGSTVAANVDPRHRLLPEKAGKVAKVVGQSLRKPEMWAELGRAIAYARADQQLSLKEFAARMDKDERQVARWEAADERPQIEAVFAVREFRAALVIGLGRQVGDELTVETTLRRRR